MTKFKDLNWLTTEVLHQFLLFFLSIDKLVVKMITNYLQLFWLASECHIVGFSFNFSTKSLASFSLCSRLLIFISLWSTFISPRVPAGTIVELLSVRFTIPATVCQGFCNQSKHHSVPIKFLNSQALAKVRETSQHQKLKRLKNEILDSLF